MFVALKSPRYPPSPFAKISKVYYLKIADLNKTPYNPSNPLL